MNHRKLLVPWIMLTYLIRNKGIYKHLAMQFSAPKITILHFTLQHWYDWSDQFKPFLQAIVTGERANLVKPRKPCKPAFCA